MNNDLSPMSILGLLDTTKAERGTFVAQVINALLSGYADPMNVHLQVKCMEEICKAIKEHPDYKTLVLDEARKYGKGYEFRNAKIDVRATAGKYDFSNDAEWCILKEAIKQRETYLKGLPPEGIERVTADGEVVTDLPPVYTPGEDAVFITLK